MTNPTPDPERRAKLSTLPPCYRCKSQPCKCKDGITLYHADCREVLPLLEPDTIVTDPVWPNASVPLLGSDRPFELFGEMCKALPGSVKRLAVQMGCDTDPMLMSCVPPRLAFFRVCWLEYVPPHYKGRLLYTSDVAYLYGEPPPSAPGRRVIPGRCLPTARNGYKSSHPCPRKPQHVCWLVKWWSEQTDLIVDPFAGSGTTGEACQDMNTRCVLIEAEKAYCDIAVERLRQGVLPFGEDDA